MIPTRKYFTDENAAINYLERLRWPNGPICPHCGSKDRSGRLNGVRSKPSKKTPRGPARRGLWKCYAPHCRKQFTVLVKTRLQDLHMPLNKLLLAIYLLCFSKGTITGHRLSEALEINYRSAWRLAELIRAHAAVQTPRTFAKTLKSLARLQQ